MSESDPETVWLVPRTHGRKPKLHTDPECPTLNGRKPHSKKRSLVPDYDMCKHCEGYEPYRAAGETKSMRHRLSDMNPEDIGLSPLEGDRE